VILLVGATLALVGTATYKLLRHGLLTEIERDVARRATTFAASRPQPPYPSTCLRHLMCSLQVVDRRRNNPWPARGTSADACCPWMTGCGQAKSWSPAWVDARCFSRRHCSRRHLHHRRSLTGHHLWRAAPAAGSPLHHHRRRAGGSRRAELIVARAALRPVERVAAAAEAVKRGRDLRQRVTYAGPPDELGRLAASSTPCCGAGRG